MSLSKKGVIVIVAVVVIVLIAVLLMSPYGEVLLSPGASQQKDVSVVVAGVDPVTVVVHDSPLASGVVPNEGGFVTVNFIVTVSDPNGINDIIDSSVNAQFNLSTETARYTPLCTPNGQNTALSKNYSCSIDMWYFDKSGDWSIIANATDQGNGTVVQGLGSFLYQPLKSMDIVSPSGALTFDTLIPGGTNILSNNDPVSLNNTGNYDGSLEVEAINLYGDGPVPTEFIDVSNFASSDISGSECSGIALSNGTFVSITNINAGNLSAGEGITSLYFCVTNLPISTSAQAYSTTQAGGWTLRI